MNRNRGGERRRRSERGAAAVEMALVLPVLLFLVFGIIDFGRMLNAQITLTEAAREGARAEALNQNPATRVTAATPNLSGVTWAYQHSSGSPGQCPASPGPTDDAGIETRYTFKFVTPIAGIAVLFGGTFGGNVTLTGEGVMPCLA
jgi:hypothetical protein